VDLPLDGEDSAYLAMLGGDWMQNDEVTRLFGGGKNALQVQ
jgi:hypothetical protein